MTMRHQRCNWLEIMCVQSFGNGWEEIWHCHSWIHYEALRVLRWGKDPAVSRKIWGGYNLKNHPASPSHAQLMAPLSARFRPTYSAQGTFIPSELPKKYVQAHNEFATVANDAQRRSNYGSHTKPNSRYIRYLGSLRSRWRSLSIRPSRRRWNRLCSYPRR